MQHKLAPIDTHAFDFWLARGAVVVVAVLQYFIVNDLSLGPRWLAPGLEIALLVPLSIATRWNQLQARRAVIDDHWHAIVRHRRMIRALALLLTAVITIMNFGALFELVRALLAGKSENGTTLLLDAVNIWVTNVIVFALWFWGIDRGGPELLGISTKSLPEFLFPQMTIDRGEERPFLPGFVDYLFLSFTNATAFSPTDTLPLSPRAKLLMMAEALISLLTIALVAARAVNILA